MKKLITSSVLIGILALIMVSPVVVVAQGVPGETRIDECCLIKHDLKPIGGDTAGPTKGAIAGPDATAECDVTIDFPSMNWGAYCVIDTVYTITDWIFWIAFVIAAVIIIIGGIMFMTAVGNPEKAKTARNVLVFGLIGIIIAVLAKLIPAFARFFVGA